MRGHTGSLKRIPAATLAEIAGITRQLHGQWADRGLLRDSGRQGCDEFDAIEVAALRSLMGCLGPEDAKIAWTQIRPKLRDRLPAGRIDVVYDSQEKLGTVAYTDGEVAQAVRNGRPVRVIPLDETLSRVRQSFHRALLAQYEVTAGARPVGLRAADNRTEYKT